MAVIPEEPQLSLPLTSGLEAHEPCTAGSLHVWPSRETWVVGAQWKMSMVSLKLIGAW